MAHALAAAVFAALLVVAVLLGRWHIARDPASSSQPPTVVLRDRPVWMTEFLANQIARAASPAEPSSAFDQEALRSIHKRLQANPWVKQVKQVRRAYGRAPGDTIEIDCEFRAPVALVHWGDYYWLVDGEAAKLPEQFSAANLPQLLRGPGRQMNIRIIEGIRQPPPETGRSWLGDDLAAGLDLVKLLYGQPYTDEIIGVDVSNYDGRVDPLQAQLVLVTRYGTEIHWGQPVNSREAFPELSPGQKLAHLRNVYDERHRVDGGYRWLDIRFDAITYPAEQATANSMP
jgi:hypothetical protein